MNIRLGHETLSLLDDTLGKSHGEKALDLGDVLCVVVSTESL